MSGLIRIAQSLPLVIALGIVAAVIYFIVSYTRSPLRAKEILIKVFTVLSTALSVLFGIATLYAGMEGHVVAAEMFGAFLVVSLIALVITMICRHNFRKHHPAYEARAQWARTHSHTETDVRNLVERLRAMGVNFDTLKNFRNFKR